MKLQNTTSLPSKSKSSNVSEATSINIDVANDLLTTPYIPELFQPLQLEAEQKLAVLLRGNYTKTLHDDFVECYIRTVAKILNPVLIQRFSAFRLIANPLWRPSNCEPGVAANNSPRVMLDAYIEWEKEQDLLATTGPYPELSRLLSITLANWHDLVTEILTRTELHKLEIADMLVGNSGDLQVLTGASFGISDPHNNGRTAAILSFGQHKLVYKPRSLQPELFFASLLNKVSERACGLSNYQTKILSFEDYGFMEFVEHDPCSNVEGVEHYFIRFGVLTAVAHALGCCDLHHENIIASGQYPIVVDAEPLFRARLGLSDFGENRLEFERSLSIDGLDARESILELGILPMRLQSMLRNKSEESTGEYEIGGLAPYLQTPRKDLLPCGIGSDDLQFSYHDVIAEYFPNLPHINGKAQFAADYTEFIIQGFEASHRYICANKSSLLVTQSLPFTAQHIPIRLLARPTMDYSNFLGRSYAPELLTSTQQRKEFIKSDLEIATGLRFDAIADAIPLEVESMFNGDIPKFELKANGCGCCLKLHATPYEAVQQRISELDNFDCNLQSGAIKEALALRHDQLIESREHNSVERHSLNFVQAIVDSAQDFNGTKQWVYASYLPGLGSTMNHADLESLYEGAAGTAIIVAEAGRVANNNEWQKLAANVFQPLLKGATPKSINRTGGLGRGLGGLVYSLIRVGVACDRDDLIKLAGTYLEKYGAKLAIEPGLDEMLYGRAGLLLACLSYLKHKQSSKVEKVAALAANKLIDKAQAYKSGVAWPLSSRQAMSNVSHGNSGIAMALARWANYSGQTQAADFALSALRADDEFWHEHENGWIDARAIGTSPLLETNWAWCNGRAGGMLARAAIADSLSEQSPLQYFDLALSANSTDVLEDMHPGLCCGTPGVYDALEAVQRKIENDKLSKHLDKATTLIQSKALASHYSTQMPSLFSGSGGLAFSLLRTAFPEQIEPILWFN